VTALRRAFELNPDLAGYAADDLDFADLRERGDWPGERP
jgi:hypothetical protein